MSCLPACSSKGSSLGVKWYLRFLCALTLLSFCCRLVQWWLVSLRKKLAKDSTHFRWLHQRRNANNVTIHLFILFDFGFILFCLLVRLLVSTSLKGPSRISWYIVFRCVIRRETQAWRKELTKIWNAVYSGYKQCLTLVWDYASTGILIHLTIARAYVLSLARSKVNSLCDVQCYCWKRHIFPWPLFSSQHSGVFFNEVNTAWNVSSVSLERTFECYVICTCLGEGTGKEYCMDHL